MVNNHWLWFVTATGPYPHFQKRYEVYRARHGGPRTSSRTIEANLDCAFVESARVFVVKNWRAWPLRPPDSNVVKKSTDQISISDNTMFSLFSNNTNATLSPSVDADHQVPSTQEFYE